MFQKEGDIFNIKKEEKGSYFLYKIHFNDKRPEGIIITKPQSIRERFDSKNFIKLGLTERDLLAYVLEFYPIGNASESMLKGYNHNGTGLEILTIVMEDLSKNGFKAIDIIATGGYKKKILEKGNFLKNGDHYYRKI
jgi:hypothetical protein